MGKARKNDSSKAATSTSTKPKRPKSAPGARAGKSRPPKAAPAEVALNATPVTAPGSAAPPLDLLDPPPTPDALHAWIERTLGFRIARTPLIPGHAAPFDYLCHSYFEASLPPPSSLLPLPTPLPNPNPKPLPPPLSPPPSFLPPPNPDCIVWANRGGGKTFLGALATLLDLLFKPKCQVRILAGSVEQGKRMYEHLRDFLEADALAHLPKRITARRIVLRHTGAAVEILAASQASVRGTRIQKLRCDEVDLFDPDVWSAAQLVTRSITCNASPWGSTIRGSVEALSTMHRPYGMMWTLVGDPGAKSDAKTVSPLSTQRAVRKAEEDHPEPLLSLPQFPASLSALSELSGDTSSPITTTTKPRRPLFRWGLLDVLERCAPERSCDSCPLHDECQGRAKLTPAEQAGHILIDDAAAMKLRVGRDTWESEMLCLRPSRSSTVYPEFDPRIHVFGRDTAIQSLEDLRADCPPFVRMLGAMDFGSRSESALLLVGETRDGVLCVVREHCKRDTPIDRQLDVLDSWHSCGLFRRREEPGDAPPLDFIGIDPAGNSHDVQTGKRTTAIIAQRGYTTKHRPSLVPFGVSRVRDRIIPAYGPPAALFGPALFRESPLATAAAWSPGAPPTRLLVHASCTRLIECLTRYHYDENKPDTLDPAKDGFDHACDALRYLVINLDAPYTSRGEHY